MVGARRVVVICEWALFFLLGLWFLVLMLDLPWAVFARNCSVRPITQGCYPWGGEGPVADAGWNYASKRNYLVSGFFNLGVVSVMLLSASLLPSGFRIIPLLGAFALMRAGQYFLPIILGPL